MTPVRYSDGGYYLSLSFHVRGWTGLDMCVCNVSPQVPELPSAGEAAGLVETIRAQAGVSVKNLRHVFSSLSMI